MSLDPISVERGGERKNERVREASAQRRREDRPMVSQRTGYISKVKRGSSVSLKYCERRPATE